MHVINKHLSQLGLIALMLGVSYSAYALPSIADGQTVTYNSDRSNNDLFEIYGTLNNSAGLTNNNEIYMFGFLNNNTTGLIINTTSATLTNYGVIHNSGNLTNAGTYNDHGSLINSGTYFNDAHVYAGAYIENTATGTLINMGEFSNGYNPIKNFGAITNSGIMTTSELQNHGAVFNGINGVYNSEVTHNTGTIQNEGEFNSYYNFENTGHVTGAGRFISDGNFLKNNGQMTQASFQINRGTVSGSGIFNGDMTLERFGNFAPDATLTLNGNLTSYGNYYFGFFGGPLAREGNLVVNGDATFFDGVFNIDFSDSYSVYDGLSLTLMTSNQFTGLEKLTYKVKNLNTSIWSYKINTTGTRISILISAVPEPENYAMLMAGLVLVSLRSRQRKYM